MHKWMRYDLHLHSYYSKPFEKSGKVVEMSVEKFVDILLGKGIEVFSITDHCCFKAEYYKKIQEYISDKNIKVIYGCEFNVYLTKEEATHFQANIYFSPNSNPDEIEEALKKLYSSSESRPLLDEIISELYARKFDFMIFPEADKSGGIGAVWRKIVEKGQVDRFIKNGMQRVFKAYDSTESFNNTSVKMWALNYYKATKEFDEYIKEMDETTITKLTREIVHYLKGDLTNHEYTDEVKKLGNIISSYGRNFTYFKFSDWHNGSEYYPKYKNYVYGNSDLPYSSLELAVLDPVSRITILNENEELSTPINFIKNIQFKLNNELQSIDFSEGLNAIVGKRASGKSLLMSIILELNKKDGKNLKKYNNYLEIDLDSITCETSDGQILKRGQLDSLMYIEQNTISNIFENPENAAENIKQYFIDLPEIDFSSYENIVKELKSLQKMDYNYKSLNSIILYSHTMKHFVFKHFSKIDITDIKSDSENILKTFDSLIKELNNIGFSTHEIKKQKHSTYLFLRKTAKKISLYNEMIELLNSNIDETNKNNNSSNERTRLARLSFDSSFAVLSKNLDNLLSLKKLSYLIDNFKIDLPNATSFKKGNYIFVSNYYVENEDIKQALLENITSNISKNRGGHIGFPLIKDYVFNPAIQLKAQSTSLYGTLENKFIKENIKVSRNIFEEKNTVDLKNLKTIEDFIYQTKCGNLDDISRSSLGKKSITYLELMLDSSANILLFDQPEDNIDNDYISNYFVPLIKEKKKTKQLIFITHNPSVAVYADAFDYIFAFNNGKIIYENHYIETLEDKEKIVNILDGGMISFSNRNLKYGNIIGEYEYGAKTNKK